MALAFGWSNMSVVTKSGWTPTRSSKNARIGHATITRVGTLSASGEAVGFEADAALNPLTYDFWKPDALPATWRIDALAATSVNYVGIAAHTLGTSSSSVQVQYSDNDSAWTDASDIHTPVDDTPIMFLFNSSSHRYWRIQVTGSTIPLIGVVFIGSALEMPRSIYGSHSPIELSRNTIIRPQVSEGGQFLGRSRIRTGFSTDFAWTNLDPTFYRDEFDLFVQDARCFPFFIAWRPLQFPNALGYAWMNMDVKPSNSGVANLMQVSITVQGLGVD